MHYPEPSKGSIMDPKRASDKVRGTEAGYPNKTGESVAQGPAVFNPDGPGGSVVEDAGDPQEEY